MRPHCQQPSTCVAVGDGHCRRCQAGRLMADAAIRARMTASRQQEAIAWCPVDLRPLFSRLSRKVGREDARAAIEAEIAFRQQRAA